MLALVVGERPISVKWNHLPPPAPPSPPASPRSFFRFTRTEPSSDDEDSAVEGTTAFKYLIDASGRAGIMSTRYWTGVKTYGKGTAREGAPWFEALTDESGWAWFIPLHDGTTSVGIVMNQDVYKRNNRLSGDYAGLNDRYKASLALAPDLAKLVGDGDMIITKGVRMATDFSYSSPSYGGPGYRIVGDAGAFIDPLFSSGIHLAMTSALSAAATICASIRKSCSESFAAQWHTKRVSTSYTRFQLVVLSAYKQIRAQSSDVLLDVEEDNFDRAFAFLRPVIQGASDMGAHLSEDELQKSLDFCMSLFNPTTPEQHEKIGQDKNISKELLDVTKPIIHPDVLKDALYVCPPDNDQVGEPRVDDVKTSKLVLNKINARRLVHAEYDVNNLEAEPLDGYVVHLETGKLDLIPV